MDPATLFSDAKSLADELRSLGKDRDATAVESRLREWDTTTEVWIDLLDTLTEIKEKNGGSLPWKVRRHLGALRKATHRHIGGRA